MLIFKKYVAGMLFNFVVVGSVLIFYLNECVEVISDKDDQIEIDYTFGFKNHSTL